MNRASQILFTATALAALLAPGCRQTTGACEDGKTRCANMNLIQECLQGDWRDFETCMSCRMREAELVVSMGGYNTLCELAVQRRPALIVPRITPRLEQDIRARLWERLGLVRVLSRRALSAQSMATRVADMLNAPPVLDTPRIDLGGLDRVADRFDQFTFEEPGRAIALRM